MTNDRFTYAALALMGLTALAGCPGPEAAECRFNADCAEPREYCDAATDRCAQFECIEDADCESDEICNTISRVCIPGRVDTDAGGDTDMGGPDPDSGQQCPTGQVAADVPGENQTCWRTCVTPSDCMTTERCEEHSGVSVCVPAPGENNGDTTPPEVTSVSPDPSDGLIPADVSFAITFNEPMDPISISEFSIILEDVAGNQIPLQLSYDDQTQIATATPSSPLAGASRYELTINMFVRDVALNFMTSERTFTYYTAFEETPEAKALAERWAPLVYQEVHDTSGLQWRFDVPTTVDFDQDIIAANNKSNALTAPNYKARVYYHVTETSTHSFIHYVFYYPARALTPSETGTRTYFEHDMTGAVFVVDKAADQLILVESVRIEDGQDILISYLREGSGVDIPGAERFKGRFKASELEGGERYRMYIPSGRHEGCYWHDDQPRPPLDVCRHPKSGFIDEGVLIRPGTAQGYDEAAAGAGGIQEFEYGLEPLASLFWLRRDSYGSGGLFERGFTYRPNGDRPQGPDEDTRLVLPNRLYSTDVDSYGDTPFQWLVQGTDNNPGQWLVDPAWTLPRRYSYPQNYAWSLDYCSNLFLNVTSCP